VAPQTGRGHLALRVPLLPSLHPRFDFGHLSSEIMAWHLFDRTLGRSVKAGTTEYLRILVSMQSNQIESSSTLHWPITKEEPRTSAAEARALR